MKKNYLNPTTEIVNVTPEVIMDGIHVTHHSGGSFDEGDII